MKLIKISEDQKSLSQMKREGKLWKPKSKSEAIWAIRFMSFIKAIQKEVKSNVAHYLETSCKDCEEYFDEEGNGINKITMTRTSIVKDEYYKKREEEIKRMQEELKDYGETLPKKEFQTTYYKPI